MPAAQVLSPSGNERPAARPADAGREPPSGTPALREIERALLARAFLYANPSDYCLGVTAVLDAVRAATPASDGDGLGNGRR